MKTSGLLLAFVLFFTTTQAQELPHRMRVGLSLDLVGNTLGIGTQLHGSFRFSDDYRAFDDVHHYVNAGIGVGASFSSGVSIGATVPHYLTVGIGRGRAMWEFGLAGVRREHMIFDSYTDPQTGQRLRDRRTEWRYLLLPLVGYRYTAYSGFMFRINGPVPGIAFGWMF
ncbi:hypothetical protein [Spirosoma montaniterrae]|uniref:Outer membrane protein beta-barrel domain-containing protein n=1 Tax=Spirosoma montaniterrae TaxID=1178516 RepID=A0A1P9WU19_9BACT|nr:hypothetical protein [Spirosoma montaniterrae]AQG78886.1 hypothetical protein AWR27_05830 [Spirosoma montaniterrae]